MIRNIFFHLLITDGIGVCSAETDMMEGSSENIILVIVDMVDMEDMVDMMEGSSEKKIIVGIGTRTIMMITMLIMITKII